MKKSISFLLAVLLLVSTLFGMLACNPSPDEPVSGDDPTEEQPPENNPPEDTPPVDDPSDEDPTESTPTPEELMKTALDNYNYLIGTQAFSPNYQFTDLPPLYEIAERIEDLGSNAIKFHATTDAMVDQLLKKYDDFRYIFMWYRSDPIFRDGYSEAEAQADYNAIYSYTKRLLTKYNNSGISFYLGHWEGDWYYIDNYNTSQKTVSDTITEGMIAWLNNRQKAVDDAKRDTPHENVEVWNYVELNRPTDALNYGYDRIVNRVLPYTNVDYVSYSAYDCMDLSAGMVAAVIDYIYENLPAKEGVPGNRVFIGEVGQPAANCDFDPVKHNEVNCKNLAKFLACPVQFVLYWQMYCNEKLEDGSSRGFWLVNDQGEEQPLYYSLQSALDSGRAYVKSYYEEHGEVPSEADYRAFLLTLPQFSN